MVSVGLSIMGRCLFGIYRIVFVIVRLFFVRLSIGVLMFMRCRVLCLVGVVVFFIDFLGSGMRGCIGDLY